MDSFIRATSIGQSTRFSLAHEHMNILTLGADFVKIVEEHGSIASTLQSLRLSLSKLLAQKDLCDAWDDLGLVIQPRRELLAVIQTKARVIQTEIAKLR